jgi:hypothetical protein
VDQSRDERPVVRIAGTQAFPYGVGVSWAAAGDGSTQALPRHFWLVP